MNGPLFQGDIRPKRYFLVVSVSLGVLFALVSSEDDSINSLQSGFLYLLGWQLQTVIPTYLAIGCQQLFNRRLPHLNNWWCLSLSGTTAGLVFAPVAWFIDQALIDINSTEQRSLLGESLEFIPPFVLAWLAINAPFVLGWQLISNKEANGPSVRGTQEQQQRIESETANSEPSAEAEEFWRLVPKHLGTDLLYLQSELHYVKVVTREGETLVLFALAKAAELLGGELGMQVHRSYYACFNGIQSYQRQGREGRISYPGGALVPVSRSKRSAVEDAIKAKVPGAWES